MNKRLLASSLALLAGAGIFVACESTNGPQAVDESLTVEESFDISALESETGILRTAGVNADSANAFFVLRWSQGHGRFQDSDTIKGHASAVAYREPTTLRDRNAAGLDMGTVSVLNGQNTYELTKIVNEVLGVRYGMFGGPKGPKGGFGGPRGGHGGPHGDRGGLNGDPIALVNIPFVAGGTYQFAITGSENVAAMTLDIQAPAQLVQITGLADKDTIDATQDLTIAWQGDAAANSVVLVIAPAFKRGRFDGTGQPVEPIFQRVDAAAGSYTIAAQTLQDLLSASNANAINLHLTQSEMREITDADLGKILISAGNDDRVVLIVQ